MKSAIRPTFAGIHKHTRKQNQKQPHSYMHRAPLGTPIFKLWIGPKSEENDPRHKKVGYGPETTVAEIWPLDEIWPYRPSVKQN